MSRWAAALAALSLAACGSRKESETQAAAPAPMRLATAATANVDWPITVEASGTVVARIEAKVASRVMGYVRDVKVREGDTVRAGQTLVVLEAGELAAQQRGAEAAADEARAGMAEADQAIEAARATLDLASKTYARMQDLHAKHSLTEQEFDESAARKRQAEAGLQMAEQRKKQAQAAIAAATEQSHAAAIVAGYTSLTAPFAGLVTARDVDPGSLAAPGAPLLTIERSGGYRLEAALDENWISRLHAGQAAEVHLDGQPTALAGRVGEIVPAIDSGSRTFIAKIDLPSAPGLRAGLFGRATFQFGSRQTLAAPASAASPRGQMTWMFVVENGIARARIVTVGEHHRDLVEVLSGMSPGERVVAPVPAGLLDGTPVEAQN